MADLDLSLRTRQNKERNTNLEILRIIAMFLILAHHFAYHCPLAIPWIPVTFNHVWQQLLLIGGKLGVDIFVLISGYFLINSKVSFSKIIRFILQVWTYSIGVYLVLICIKPDLYSGDQLLKMFFPFYHNNYWFARTYLFIYLLSPIVNAGLKNVKKHQYQLILIFLFIVWVVISTVTNNRIEVNNLLWFLFMYSSAAYFRLYPPKLKKPLLVYGLVGFGFLLSNFIMAIINDYIYVVNKDLATHIKAYYGEMTIPIFISALFIFLFFNNLKVKNNKYVNIVASCMFSVYLIHENPVMRQYLWKDLLLFSKDIAKTNYFAIYSIGILLAIFIICIIVELIRKYALEKWYMIPIRKLEPKVNSLIDKIFNRNKEEDSLSSKEEVNNKND